MLYVTDAIVLKLQSRILIDRSIHVVDHVRLRYNNRRSSTATHHPEYVQESIEENTSICASEPLASYVLMDT